ncbi:CyP450 monooxygenase [Cubamyces lactineus]|nr:CyP450 monooxygenase [Cubamyces lactineus]
MVVFKIQLDHNGTRTVLTIALVLLQVSLAFVLQRWLRKRARKILPPGPRGLPLLGNIYDIPQTAPWVTYRDLKATYGDVICVRLLGHPVIVLNSLTAVNELLEKRSAIYSDRPVSVVSVSRTLNSIWILGFKPCDDDWRRTRRQLWQYLQPSAVTQWQPIQARESRRFLQCLLHDQRDLHKLIQLSFCRSLLNVGYGLPASDVTSRYADLLSEMDSGVSEAYDPTILFIPWLRYLPRWLPGGTWKSGTKKWRLQADSILETPYKAAMRLMTNGDVEPSILTKLFDKLQSAEPSGLDEEFVKGILATIFVAGADTSSGSLFAFFCAMVMYPEVQKRAQEELDAVVGPDRLPEHTDRPALPYISAIIKEVLRWHNIVPLGMAHRCMEDNEYRGWIIPEDATIMVNMWGILHDPEHFTEPDAFRPERFLKDGKLDPDAFDPAILAFGSGRRVCPGRHFAEDALFISIASVLHVFDILPAIDEYGQPIPVEHYVTSGLISTVKPFEYSIRPRSSAAEALVRDAMSGED